MMDSRILQDRQYLALGIAARRTGDPTDAFRPVGACDPLAKVNRFLRLNASFVSKTGSLDRPNSYGVVEWQGIFDASYTMPGDYLVQKTRIFFIAAQQPLLPVLCVQTNRTISIARPGVETSTAANPYGGYSASTTSSVMDNWPASVLGITSSGQPAAGLPTDQAIPYLSVLLPAPAGVVLTCGDLISDDLGRSAVITSTELTPLGWRLSAKLATT